MPNMINASIKKVGGIWFIRLGRINLSISVTKQETFDLVEGIKYAAIEAVANRRYYEAHLAAYEAKHGTIIDTVTYA